MSEQIGLQVLSVFRGVHVRRVIDALSQEEWRVWYDERVHALVLDEYVYGVRSSLRHRIYEPVRRYTRILSRGSDTPLDEVPFPDEVKAAVKQAWCAVLTVEKERQRCRRVRPKGAL